MAGQQHHPRLPTNHLRRLAADMVEAWGLLDRADVQLPIPPKAVQRGEGAALVFTGSQGIARELPRSVKTTALAPSLVLSALLTAVALRLHASPNAQRRCMASIASSPGNPALDSSPGSSPCTPDSGRSPNLESGGRCAAIFVIPDTESGTRTRFPIEAREAYGIVSRRSEPPSPASEEWIWCPPTCCPPILPILLVSSDLCPRFVSWGNGCAQWYKAGSTAMRYPANFHHVDAFRPQGWAYVAGHAAETQPTEPPRRWTWARMSRLINRWLPRTRILRPYPNQRMIVTTQGRSPMRDLFTYGSVRGAARKGHSYRD